MTRRALLSLTLFAVILAQPAGAQTPSPGPSSPRAPIVAPSTVGDPWTPDETAALQHDLDALLAGAPALRGAHVGVLASDTRTGATLYARNADDEFQPASTFKLLVGSAALEKLGEDYRFRTTASLARIADLPGVAHGGVLWGALVVHGGGDPFLSVRDIDNLALAVAQSGIKHIRGPVLIDASRYDRAPYAPGWTWDDFTYDYAAKASALTVDENVVHVHVEPGALRGWPARVSVDPPVVAVASSVVTLARGASTSADVDPDPSGRLHLSGGIALGAGRHAIDAAVADPQAYARKVLVARLRAHGVDVARTRAVDLRSASETRRIWKHLSPPLSELLPRFWLPSDNLVGEMFLKELGFVSAGAPGTTLKGVAYEKRWLQALGIDLSILGQLILDDPVYRLGRDSQATGNLLRRAADQRAEHELLEAISVGYVLAFERGDNVLPVVTPRTAMEGSLVNPETGLLPQVEVPDRLGDCFELDVGDVVVATFFTAASYGQGPPHLQAMALLIPLVTGDFHLG